MNRVCKECGVALGAGRRSDAVYCSTACRTQASRVRRGIAAPEPYGGEAITFAVAFPWGLFALTFGALLSVLIQ